MTTFYGSDTPDVGDYVIGIITDIQETIGYFVILPEYADKKAYVGLKEISRKRYKKLKGIVKEGDLEVMEITTIEKGNVDASRKYLDEDRVQACMTKYKHHKKIYDWLKFTDYFPESVKVEYISSVLHSAGDEIPEHLRSLP